MPRPPTTQVRRGQGGKTLRERIEMVRKTYERRMSPLTPRQDVEKLAAVGARPAPDWLPVKRLVPPQLPPLKKKKGVKEIFYPEDRLRKKLFEVYPHLRHSPVNVKSTSWMTRHVSDKFVYNQMKLMDQGLSEEAAFHTVNEKFKEDVDERTGSDLYARLLNPRIKDYYARVFQASWADSNRDKFIYRNFTGKSPPGTPKGKEITLEDIIGPGLKFDVRNDEGESESHRAQEESAALEAEDEQPHESDSSDAQTDDIKFEAAQADSDEVPSEQSLEKTSSSATESAPAPEASLEPDRTSGTGADPDTGTIESDDRDQKPQ